MIQLLIYVSPVKMIAYSVKITKYANYAYYLKFLMLLHKIVNVPPHFSLMIMIIPNVIAQKIPL